MNHFELENVIEDPFGRGKRTRTIRTNTLNGIGKNGTQGARGVLVVIIHGLTDDVELEQR